MVRLSAFGASAGAGFGGPSRRGYLQLIVGPHATYEDGDVKSAVPWVRVRRFTAEGLCHPKNAPKTGNVRDFTHHSRRFLEMVKEFKLERTGPSTGRITRLSDAATIDFTTNTPFVDFRGKTVQMDLNGYIKSRLNHDRHRVFGALDAEVLYGGRTAADDAVLDDAWAMIEAETGIMELDLQEAPFSNHRKYLTITVNNFDDETGGSLTAGLFDMTNPDEPIQVKKRKSWIRWRDLRDVVEADVLDRQKSVRIDGLRKHVRQEIVMEKVP